jgi:hypothetical protein
MSLLHHFGQVKRKYEPYVSPIPAFDFKQITWGIVTTVKDKKVEISTSDEWITGPGIVPVNKGKTILYKASEDDDIYSKLIIKFYRMIHSYGASQSPVLTPVLDTSIDLQTLYRPDLSVFIFTNLTDTFSKCLAVVREKMESLLWKTIDCCPFVNIMDLLILKHADTDSHIEHLEKLVMGLIDDNKTLQTKINSLEQQMTLFKKKEEKREEKEREKTSIPIAYPLRDISVAEQVLFDLD